MPVKLSITSTLPHTKYICQWQSIHLNTLLAMVTQKK